MPLLRPVGQHLGFRPPEQQQPRARWVGPLAGDLAGGGGFTNRNVVHQFWRDFAQSDEQFVVQLVAEDVIVGDGVRRVTRLESHLKTDVLNSAQARRMAAALSAAADLID